MAQLLRNNKHRHNPSNTQRPHIHCIHPAQKKQGKHLIETKTINKTQNTKVLLKVEYWREIVFSFHGLQTDGCPERTLCGQGGSSDADVRNF